MLIGMSIDWRRKQPKQQQCQRCELYFSASLDNLRDGRYTVNSSVVTGLNPRL